MSSVCQKHHIHIINKQMISFSTTTTPPSPQPPLLHRHCHHQPPPTTIIVQPLPTTPTMTTTWQCHITSPMDEQQQWMVTTATDMPCHPDGDNTCCCHVHINQGE